MTDLNETPEPELGGRRVLVVEDEFFLADDMCRELTANGLDVVGPANTLDKAGALLGDGGIDFAVLDVNVKGQLVFPLAQELRRRAVPFVFTTGYGSEMIPPEFQDVVRWEKPFTIAGLMRSLNELGL